jgi:hypothetical protein
MTADDLPLNVSRETLQSTKFLKQLKQVILRRLIQLIGRLAEEEPEKFDELQKNFGSVLKLGAVEDQKNGNKLALLTRFATNQRNSTSFNEVRYGFVLYLRLFLMFCLRDSTWKTRKKARSRCVSFVQDQCKIILIESPPDFLRGRCGQVH